MATSMGQTMNLVQWHLSQMEMASARTDSATSISQGRTWRKLSMPSLTSRNARTATHYLQSKTISGTVMETWSWSVSTRSHQRSLPIPIMQSKTFLQGRMWYWCRWLSFLEQQLTWTREDSYSSQTQPLHHRLISCGSGLRWLCTSSQYRTRWYGLVIRL